MCCLSLAACTGEDGDNGGGNGAGSNGPDVIVPGSPGEQASTVPADEAAKNAGEPDRSDKPNDADVEYVQMMIPHHRQAIVMTDLVEGRAKNDAVKRIAGRIDAAQDAEITMMTTWLKDFGQEVPADDEGGHGDPDEHGDHGGHGEHGGHDHADMPGMATPEQLRELRAAKGTEFDRMFLTLMITHHEGALTMAEKELANGVEARAITMAQDVMTSQTNEIAHMKRIRNNL